MKTLSPRKRAAASKTAAINGEPAPVTSSPPTPPSSPADHHEAAAFALLEAMLALQEGNFSKKLPSNWTGVYGKIADTFNDVLSINQRRAQETTRICRVVCKEGKLKQRLRVPGLVGGWAAEVESLNELMDDLVRPTTDVTRTIGAVAQGDLSQAMTLEVDGRGLEGEFLVSARLVNRMIE
ncbi:MAG: HAMP domain-containing protein, partial [Roseimicrobium sp.]